MIIKPAYKEDIPVIKKLAETIWPICYKEIISLEQISYMLKLIYETYALEKQIEKGHQFILAYNAEMPIGFASYSPKSLTEPHIFRLHKIYVVPNLSIKGVGSLLLETVCNAAKSAKANVLELNVNKYNTAINFYKKKGFAITAEEVIDIGNGYLMDDYIMQKAL
jgi:diamine N-acetyltransferase